MKERENLHWNTDKGAVSFFNKGCDWLILTTTLNVIGLLNCVIKKLFYDLASELVENKEFLNQSQSRKL